MSLNNFNQTKQRKAVEAVRREEAERLTQANKDKKHVEILEEFNFDDLEEIGIRHKNITSRVKRSGALSVINSENRTPCIRLANTIWRDLGYPRFVRVFLRSKRMFVIAGKDYGIAVRFHRKMPFEKAVEVYKRPIVLYAKKIVKRLTDEWNLEFDSKHRYIGGFHKKCTINGIPAIVITKDNIIEVSEVTTTDDAEDVVECNGVNAVGDED